MKDEGTKQEPKFSLRKILKISANWILKRQRLDLVDLYNQAVQGSENGAVMFVLLFNKLVFTL